MAGEKTSLSPRETAWRMLQHMPEDVSYEDIMRQLRVLQQIEWVMTDVEMAGLSGEPNSDENVLEREDEMTIPYSAKKSSLVLRSRPLFNWRSLAERSEDRTDPFFGKASWIY